MIKMIAKHLNCSSWKNNESHPYILHDILDITDMALTALARSLTATRPQQKETKLTFSHVFARYVGSSQGLIILL